MKHFIRELGGNRVEGELIITMVYSLLTSAAIIALLYFLKLQYILDFVPKYGFNLLLASLSYAIIIPTVRQVRAYKELPCMSGMMVGMTTGMIGGFLPGFYIASTNGMFIGSVFGLATGIALGVWNGLCSGIMGFLEGIMAGFMGGLMGAMTAFMLLNDHLRETSLIVFAVSSVIIVGLNFMIYTEMRQNQRQRAESHLVTVALASILTVITVWLMVFGPRTGIFG